MKFDVVLRIPAENTGGRVLADHDAFTVSNHVYLIRGADSKCAAHPDGKNNMTEHVNCSDDSSGFQLYQPPIIYRGFI